MKLVLLEQGYRSLLRTYGGRPLRFGIVGIVTFGVQIGALVALKEAGLWGVIANAIALMLAVQFNFLVSEGWVWRDRRVAAIFGRAMLQRWLTFHGCIAFSLVINFGAFLVAREFMPDIAAAVVGIGCSTLIKFLSLDRLAFRVS